MHFRQRELQGQRLRFRRSAAVHVREAEAALVIQGQNVCRKELAGSKLKKEVKE